MTAPRPLPLSVTSRTEGTAVVIQVAGEIDLMTADDVATAVMVAIEARPVAVVLDLTEVSFLDSAGLGVLARSHMTAGEQVAFRVVATQQAVLKPVRLTGMDQMLALFGTVADALDA